MEGGCAAFAPESEFWEVGNGVWFFGWLATSHVKIRMGTKIEGLALPKVPIKMVSETLLRKFAYTGLPARIPAYLLQAF